jgi:hypothetical protein
VTHYTRGTPQPPIGFLTVAPTNQHKVEYSIVGSASDVGITARNESGGTEQYEVSLPFNHTFYTTAGEFVYLSAQKKGEDGTISVRIRVDGTLLQEATASSPYGIASASGRIPK